MGKRIEDGEQPVPNEASCDEAIFEGRKPGLSTEPDLPLRLSLEEWQNIADETRGLSPESLSLLIRLYPERMDQISRGLANTMTIRGLLHLGEKVRQQSSQRRGLGKWE